MHFFVDMELLFQKKYRIKLKRCEWKEKQLFLIQSGVGLTMRC